MNATYVSRIPRKLNFLPLDFTESPSGKIVINSIRKEIKSKLLLKVSKSSVFIYSPQSLL
ncbi:hypothetical protein LSP03_41930 [Lysinibacillus sphaericus]|nr:hypothetical protein LSP03_41930 [Lysinibacillus sphaericus]